MLSKTLATLIAAAAIPAAAQVTTAPQGEPRQATVQVQESKAAADGKPASKAATKAPKKPARKVAKKKPVPKKDLS